MSDTISKYIKKASTGDTAIDSVINDLLYPAIFMFCEIPIYYENGLKQIDGTYKFSYGNWNEAFVPEVFLNGSDTQLNPSNYSIDYTKGVITPSFSASSGDNLMCTYNFSWFTPEMLSSFLKRSVSTINYAGQGAVTSYTFDTLPNGYYGIAADLAIAMCMETLILSYTMWSGKLIFSISANQMFDGSDNIVSQLETIKHNAEDRAYKAIENPSLRAPYSIAKPTPAYYRSITVGNGLRTGLHGGYYGKSHGIKVNKLNGMTGSDLDL